MGRWVLGACLILLAGASPVSAQELSIAVGDLRHPRFSATGIELLVSLPKRTASLRIARVDAGGRRVGPVAVDCADFSWTVVGVDCRRGTLRPPRGKPVPVVWRYRAGDRGVILEARPAAGERWALAIGGGRFSIDLENADPARIADWIPELAAWHPAGRVSGEIKGRGKLIESRLRVSDGAFSDAEGRHAAEKLGAALDFTAEEAATGWRWRLRADWSEGGVYWQPAFVAAAGQQLAASGAAGADGVAVDSGRFSAPGFGDVDFSGHRSAAGVFSGRVAAPRLDLARLGETLLSPLAAEGSWPPIVLAGSVGVSAQVDDGVLTAVDLGLAGVGAADPGRRFGLAGIGGDLVWRRDRETAAVLRIEGAHYGDLAFAPFEVPLRLRRDGLAIDHLEAPLLDSRLVVDQVDVDWLAGTAEAGIALHPLSLDALTRALKLPPLAGSLSFSIPRLRRRGDAIDLDGGLVIQAFGGYASATALRLVDPFGRLPRLVGDFELRHIDLEALTRTYSFGRITGYLDGEVRGLELAGWKPVAFDARLASMPGDYRRRISQRAVENISALGGAGAAAALQRSFLRFFDDFGYARIGLTCRLRNGVCAMGGVGGGTGSGTYVIVEGGGVPALNVIGYNRRVDWDELVARLKRVTASGSRPVIE